MHQCDPSKHNRSGSPSGPYECRQRSDALLLRPRADGEWHGLCVDLLLAPATGTAERNTVLPDPMRNSPHDGERRNGYHSGTSGDLSPTAAADDGARVRWVQVRAAKAWCGMIREEQARRQRDQIHGIDPDHDNVSSAKSTSVNSLLVYNVSLQS